MSLTAYLNLPLTQDSPLAKSLFSKVTTEAQRRNIALTSPHSSDGMPPFLTPAMAGWYGGQVQPVRASALLDVVASFNSMVTSKGQLRGKLLEHEFSKIDSEMFQKIADERRLFEQNSNITDIHRELVEERQRYEGLVQQHGPAQKWRPVLYLTILVLMIFILEGLINFESFLKIPGFTPALSVGSFLGVSTAFSVSAHLVGVIIKQWRERLGGSVSRTEKMKNRSLALFAIILFVLAFGFVIYARWALLGDVILRRSQTTGEEVGTEEALRFAGTLIGNIIVYVMGIVWSYTRHDSIPGFSELRRRVERLEKQESALIEKELASRNRQHMNKAVAEKEKLRRTVQAQSAQLPNYHSGLSKFDQLREQDARVLALLEEYRTLLLEKVGEGRTVTFSWNDITRVAIETKVEMTPDEYAGKPLELRHV
ncbi:MAG: hypothetical protein WCE79_11235 [Xanthobacteraceae bacterium]